MILTKNPIMTPWMPAKMYPIQDAKNMRTILRNNFLRLILSVTLFKVLVEHNSEVTVSDMNRPVAPQCGHFPLGFVLMNLPHFRHLIIIYFSHLTINLVGWHFPILYAIIY